MLARSIPVSRTRFLPRLAALGALLLGACSTEPEPVPVAGTYRFTASLGGPSACTISGGELVLEQDDETLGGELRGATAVCSGGSSGGEPQEYAVTAPVTSGRVRGDRVSFSLTGGSFQGRLVAVGRLAGTLIASGPGIGSMPLPAGSSYTGGWEAVR